MVNVYLGCPGNGGQHHIFYEKKIIDTPENQKDLEAINTLAGHDLVGIMLDKTRRHEITDERDIQLAIVSSGLILAKKLRKKVDFEGVFGLSLGEITSCAVAGCIDDETARYVVSKRAEFMKKCVPSLDDYISEPDAPVNYMCAITHVPKRFIKKRCNHVNRRSKTYGYVLISNENTPNQTVISGSSPAVHRAVRGITRKYSSAVIIPLKTGGPWHNKFYMEPARQEMIALLEDIPFKSPDIPFYMMASMKFEKDPSRIKTNLTDAMILPVTTWESLCYIKKAGYALFMNLGPGRVLEPFFNSVGLNYITRSEVLEERIRKRESKSVSLSSL